MIEVSDWAAEVLRRSFDAARRMNPDVVIRLVARGDAVDAVLAEQAEADDVAVPIGGARVFAARGVRGLLDVEPPHDRLVLRPPGAEPATRA